MTTKKTEQSDLEPKRGLLLHIGLAVALVLVIMVLELARTEEKAENFQTQTASFEEELLQIPITQPIVPPAPPKPQPLVQELIMVDDNKEITEEFKIADLEVKESSRIEIPDYIAVDDSYDDVEFVVAEVNPQFPGGTEALMKFIAQNVNYPVSARQTGIEGKVYVRFLVTKEGKIDKESIARGVHEWLDNEAIRVISMMPNWTPGKQNGRNVNVWFTVPINFKLSE